jgi:hypothetical protein
LPPSRLKHLLQINDAVQEGPPKQQRLDGKARIHTSPNSHLVIGKEAKHPYDVPRLEPVPIRFQRAAKRIGHSLNGCAYLYHEKASQRFPRACQKLSQIYTSIHQSLDQIKHTRRATLDHDSEYLRVQIVSDQTQYFADSLGGNSPFAKAETLIQHGKRVPHAAVRVTRDQRQGVVISGNPFGSEHMAEPLPDGGGPYSSEVEPLEA